MKKKQFLGAALALIACGQACKNDAYRDFPQHGSQQVQFTSSIGEHPETRVTGSQWDAHDAIGVFMKQGAGFNQVLAANRRYTTVGNGNFSADDTEVIHFPETGNVDFVAYYPYISDLPDNKLPINVSDQSNLSAIDVLYANNATGLSASSAPVTLNFSHQLTKLEIHVQTGSAQSNLSGLAVTLQDLPTTAHFDLASGTINDVGGNQNIQAKVTSINTNPIQLVEAILLPGDYGNRQFIFTLAGAQYTWYLPNNFLLEKGKKLIQHIVLQSNDEGNAVVVTGAAVIKDWISVPGESITLDPDGDGHLPPVTGEEILFFHETFGTQGPTTNPRARIGSYTGYDMTSPVTYTDLFSGEFADIRATAQINTHVWFPAARTTGFSISGIDATGYNSLRLSYDIAANAPSAAASAIRVSVNGLHKIVEGTLGTNNTFSIIHIEDIPPASQLVVEFSTTASENTIGYRISDIKIFGTK